MASSPETETNNNELDAVKPVKPTAGNKVAGFFRRIKEAFVAALMYFIDLKVILYHSDNNLCVVVVVNTDRYKKAAHIKMQKEWGDNNCKSKELGRLPVKSRRQMIDCKIKCEEIKGRNAMEPINVSHQGECSFYVNDVIKYGGKAFMYHSLEMPRLRADLRIQCEATTADAECGGSWIYSMRPEEQPPGSGACAEAREETPVPRTSNRNDESQGSFRDLHFHDRNNVNIYTGENNGAKYDDANIQTVNNGEMEAKNEASTQSMEVKN